VLEAAASGLPILTTRRFNGAVELFQDGHDIVTINDPTDQEAMYECANALFDESLRQKLGAAARKVALGHSLVQNFSNVLRMYDGRGHRQLAA
jgi:glycosyltransferase involved in cell wall biosynthesis